MTIDAENPPFFIKKTSC